MKKRLLILLGILLLLILMYLFYGLKASTANYVLSRRIPQLLAMTITGAAIASSALLFQTITNNRILTPSILGLDSLYVLIQTGAMFIPLLIWGREASIMQGSLPDFIISIAIMVVFSVTILGSLLKLLKGNLPKLLLSGMILGMLFQSVSSFLQVIMDPNEYLLLQSKLFASFNNISTELVLPSAVVLILVIVLVYRRASELDVMNLGKDHAVGLGVNYDSLVRFGIMASAVLVAVSTALVGPITFLGILVSNLAREMIPNYRHRYLLPASMMIGAGTLILGQFLTGTLLKIETPVSVIINFIGGIYFIYLLFKGSKL